MLEFVVKRPVVLRMMCFQKCATSESMGNTLHYLWVAVQYYYNKINDKCWHVGLLSTTHSEGRLQAYWQANRYNTSSKVSCVQHCMYISLFYLLLFYRLSASEVNKFCILWQYDVSVPQVCLNVVCSMLGSCDHLCNMLFHRIMWSFT